MNNGKICISVCVKTAREVAESISKAELFADVIEIRLDALDQDEIVPAINALSSAKPLLLTYRPKAQGGMSDADSDERVAFWKKLAAESNAGTNGLWFDNEMDLAETVEWPNESIVVRSFHDFSGVPDSLNGLFAGLSSRGEIVKIAYAVNHITQAIPLWNLLDRAKSGGKSIIAIAMGEAGKWTRILGLAHGTFMTYVSPNAGSETAPGQISARDMLDVYRVKELNRNTDVYGIIGGNTSYSVSPYMHNAAINASGLNSVFIPLQVADLDDFMRRMVKPDTREVNLNFKGFSVTNPHKQAIMTHLDVIDETAEAIGAVNTVKVDGGKFYGYNTDAQGFIEPLISKFGDLKGARTAVFGAGGAARACIYALKRSNAEVSLFARDTQKGGTLAEEFVIPFHKLTTDNRQLITDFDIIVNATPLGTVGEVEEESIATVEQLRSVKFVYDLIYNPLETKLIRNAKAANVASISGLEMVLAQGAEQFKIWTGFDAPTDEMRNAVEAKLHQ